MIKFIKDLLSQLVYNPSFDQIKHNTEDIQEVINGSYKISNTTLEKSIKINGEAIIGNEVIVKEKIVVSGSLLSENAIFKAFLYANGNISLNNSHITSKSFFSGIFFASNSNFTSIISLLISKAKFNNCQIDHIEVERLPYRKSGQIIFLTNNSTVKGDIIFKSGLGKVYIDSTSLIQGQLIGATLGRC